MAGRRRGRRDPGGDAEPVRGRGRRRSRAEAGGRAAPRADLEAGAAAPRARRTRQGRRGGLGEAGAMARPALRDPGGDAGLGAGRWRSDGAIEWRGGEGIRFGGGEGIRFGVTAAHVNFSTQAERLRPSDFDGATEPAYWRNILLGSNPTHPKPPSKQPENGSNPFGLAPALQPNRRLGVSAGTKQPLSPCLVHTLQLYTLSHRTFGHIHGVLNID